MKNLDFSRRKGAAILTYGKTDNTEKADFFGALSGFGYHNLCLNIFAFKNTLQSRPQQAIFTCCSLLFFNQAIIKILCPSDCCRTPAETSDSRCAALSFWIVRGLTLHRNAGNGQPHAHADTQ